MSAPSPTRPLAGLRVLDAADGKGEFCGRVLSDLGAEVIRMEPPGGAASRSYGPRTDPSSETSESLYFALRNAGKRSITLDLDDAADRDKLHTLLEVVDVWIESSKPGTLEAQGLAPDEVIARHPHLVMTSITDYGRTGPYKDFEGTSTTAFAMSGMMHRSGAPDRPPCEAPGQLGYDAAGICAAYPTLLAYYRKLQTGRGQHIDCSVQESLVAMVDWSIPNGSIGGANMARNGAGMYPLFRCEDGYVRMIILVTSHWRALLDWMGNPEELSDPKFDQFLERMMNQALINEHLTRFFSTQKKLDVCAEGQRRGLPITPLLEPSQILDNEHTRARKTFREYELPSGETVTLPSGFLHLDGTRVGPGAGPPAVGQDDAVLRDAPAPAVADTEASGDAPEYPFEGLRVVDFGVGAVGVEVARLFADYGADVIKVESYDKPDFMRALTPNMINPSFASSSRGKRSLGVDLKTEGGRELVHRLIDDADIVVDNLATGVMARLGMDAETIRARNPRLVVVTSQSVGAQGPWKDWSGYGPSTHPTSGLHWLWNHPDATEPAGSVCTYPDHLVGRLGAVAGLAGLIQRRSTGSGVTADLAQFETPLGFLGDLFAREAIEPGSVRPSGNRSERGAPWGAYPCAGDDEWVAICVRDDRDWEALRGAIGDPDWARDGRYATAAGRHADHDAIDEALASWTRERTPQEARDALQAVGVPAGDLQHTHAILADPNLAAREFIRVLDQPGLTTMLFEGPFYRASELPPPVLEPAPLLAQHTREICREHFGMDDAAIDALVAEGVLEENRGEADA